MTFCFIIALIIFIQIGAYILLDKFDYKNWKYLVLCLILILHFFVLPYFMIAEIVNDEPKCGMPAMALLLSFWVIGGSATIISHFVYVLAKK